MLHFNDVKAFNLAVRMILMPVFELVFMFQWEYCKLRN